MKKKVWRLLSLVIAVVLALGMTVFAEGEKETPKATFSAGSVTVEQGVENAVVAVPIMFEGDAKITAVQLSVSVEGRLSFVKYAKGNVLEGVVEPALETNPVVIPFVDESLKGVSIKSGTFATLEFSVPTEVAKDYLINLEIKLLTDENFEDMLADAEAIDGKISVVDSRDVEVDEGITSEERKQDVICMMIDKPMAIADGKKRAIDSENALVTPYVTNGRTMVPLRFISENLGAEVLWEEGWGGCIIKKDGKEIAFTFGSAEFTVNGEKLTFDAPIEMLHNRTMVPVRFVSEQLGYDVYWENVNRAVVISPADNPWQEGRKAETRAINEMMISILGIL